MSGHALRVRNEFIPVRVETGTREHELVGDRDRMFDGAMREIVDGWVSKWAFTTTPLQAAKYATVMAELLTPGARSCDGFLIGAAAANCFVEILNDSPIPHSGGRRRIQFVLHRAGV